MDSVKKLAKELSASAADIQMRALGLSEEQREEVLGLSEEQREEFLQSLIRSNKRKKEDKSMDDGSVRGLIMSGDYAGIGEDVYTGQNVENVARQIVTASRRKIKKEEILLVSKDEEEVRDMSGLVFTDSKLYVFNEGSIKHVIEYTKMKDVDFDEDSVILTLSSGDTVFLNCEEGEPYDDETYSEATYNLLMDIIERVANT